MNSDIRKNRMADAIVTVLNADNRPLVNQEVTVEQTRHAFLFGTAAFDLVPFTSGDYEGEQLEQAQVARGKVLGFCNAATLPFYWARFEPERGKPITAKVKNAARWCLDHNLTTKGHPLCWHTLTADWLLSMSNAEILQAQTARIRRDVADFRGLIDMWDVINEAVIMPVFDKYDNGITRLCKEMGRIHTIKTMFETTREINPTATLLINDFDVSSAYDILVEGCLEAGHQIRCDRHPIAHASGLLGRGKNIGGARSFLPLQFADPFYRNDPRLRASDAAGDRRSQRLSSHGMADDS